MKPSGWIIAITLIGFFSTIEVSSSQAADDNVIIIERRDIKVELVDAPGYGIGLEASEAYRTNKKWLQIEFLFSAANLTKGYIDELGFKVSLEAREFQNLDDKQGQSVILNGETTYVNVVAKANGTNGTKHYGVFYVHPFTLERFGTERLFRFTGTQKSDNNNNVRIEATIGGQPQLLDKEGKKRYVDLLQDDENWAGQFKRISGYVLPKSQSPWAVIGMDRYPPEKIRNGSGS